MFLTLKTDRGKRYLYLMESIHVKGKRNCEKRIVKNYGRWEEVPEEIRRQYEDAQARKALTKQLESQARAEEFQKAQQMLSTPQSSPVAGRAYAYSESDSALLLQELLELPVLRHAFENMHQRLGIASVDHHGLH